MATFRRSTTPGASYFFTVNTYRRQKILTERPFRLALEESVRAVMAEYPFTIEAFVLLPDHLHCIWTLPPNDARYAMRWSIIKRRVSQKTQQLIETPLTASREARRELALWQRRFWEHQIRNTRDLQRHLEYIHWNPVKHGYVKRVQDWPYSSFHRFAQRGLYPIDWGSDVTVYGELTPHEFGE